MYLSLNRVESNWFETSPIIIQDFSPGFAIQTPTVPMFLTRYSKYLDLTVLYDVAEKVYIVPPVENWIYTWIPLRIKVPLPSWKHTFY